MGGTVSRSSVTDITDITTNVITKTVQNCHVDITQEETVSAKVVKGDVDIHGLKQTQSASLDLKCAFSSKTQNDIQNRLAEEIANQAKAKGGDWTSALGETKSDVQTTVKNILKTTIKTDNLQESATKTLQQQNISFDEIDGNLKISDTTQDQTTELVIKAIFDNANYNEFVNKLSEKIDNKAEAEAGGIFNLIGDHPVAFVIIMIVIVIVIGVGVYFYVKSETGGGLGAVAPMGAAAPVPAMPTATPVISKQALAAQAAKFAQSRIV